MTRLFSLVVLYKGESSAQAHVLKAAYDLSSFSFFQRGSVQEFITFTSKILAERTAQGTRQSVKEAEYMCHAFARADGLVGVCLSDHEYPHRVAHGLVAKFLDDFAGQVPRDQWAAGQQVQGFNGCLEVYMQKYQTPETADPLTRVQSELDETKIILHNTIAAVLDRGEKLDDLVAKSEGLSMQSKTFYKTAKKTNSCCGSWT